jgi:signal transduction histidine kinase
MVVGFGLLTWLGATGFDSVVSETRQIVGTNLDSGMRISEIASRLQRINATLYGLMTTSAAGRSDIDVPAQLEALSQEVHRLRADLTDYRERFATPPQVAGITETLTTLENYEGAVRWVGSMLEIDFASAVSFLRPFNAMFDRVTQRFDDITATAIADARARASQAASAANSTVLSFIVVTLLAALGISGLAWVAGRHQQRLRVTAETLEMLVTKRTQELAQRSADLEDSLVKLREAQATLVMQEKMASLGGLVAGVAHEINTPIGVALTGATMLADRTSQIREVYGKSKLRKTDFDDFLETVSTASTLLQTNIERAAHLVHTFKMVSADRTSEGRSPFDLKSYLSDVLVSLGPAYRRGGHQVTLACPDGITIDGYPGVLAQIVSNFIMNSLVHGYDAGQSGRLSITVSEPADQQVELVYDDDGNGIAPEHRGQVFDPFFTTKRGTGCTGLGLHIVYNLVTARLGGDIVLESSPGQGTRFTIRFSRTAP